MGIELAKCFVTVGADTAQASQALRGIEDDLGSLAGKAAIFGGVLTAAFGGTARSAVMAAGKYEQTMIAFSTMMGSATKATNLLENLTKFAAETPFEMPEIEQVARGMVMFGESGDSLMETLTMLGNAASGTSSSFGMIGLIFNQIRGVGKLLTQDFRQLSTRGVISLRDIAKYYKVTDAAAQEMMSRGKISFEDFRKILGGLTTGTGRFANMMEKQSKSMLGLLSTFSDAWRITMRQIGQELVPIAKEVVAFGISFVAVFAEMDSMTRKLVAGSVGVGAVFGGIGTALSGATFTVMKLHGAYTGLMATLRTTAAMTETVGGIAGVTSATVQMTAAAKGATVGLRAMAMASVATKVGLWGMVYAIAALVGYNVGKWLYGMSDEAKNTKRVMDDLSSTINNMPEVDFDKKLKGKGKDESKAYLGAAIKQIEDQIQRTKAHTRAMEEENGFWQDNSEVIAQEALLIEKLEGNLSKARDKLVEFTEAGPDLDKQLEEAEARLKFSGNEIIQITKTLNDEQAKLAKLEGATNLTQGQAAQMEMLRQNIKLHEELIAKYGDEKTAAKALADSLKEKKLESEVDLKATEKIKEKTEAMKIEADTYGMTAAEAAYYKDTMDGVEHSVAAAHAAEIERMEDLKNEEGRLAKIAKEREETFGAAAVEASRKVAEAVKQEQDEIARRSEPEDNQWFENLMQTLEWAVDTGMTPLKEMEKQIKELDKLMASGLIGPDLYKQSLESLGKSLTDSVMTPSEQLAEKTALWDAMLKKKIITQDTYNKLLWNAKRAMDAFGSSSGFADFHQKIQDAVMGYGPNGAAPAAPTLTDRYAGFAAPVAAENTMEVARAWSSAILPEAAEILGSSLGPEANPLSFDEMVILMQEGNKKTDEVVKAIKGQPKGGLL